MYVHIYVSIDRSEELRLRDRIVPRKSGISSTFVRVHSDKGVDPRSIFRNRSIVERMSGTLAYVRTLVYWRASGSIYG